MPMRVWWMAAAAVLVVGGCVQVLGNPFVIVEDDGGSGGAGGIDGSGGQPLGVGGAGGSMASGPGGGGGAPGIIAQAVGVIGGAGSDELLDMAVAEDGTVAVSGAFDGTMMVAGQMLDSGGSRSGFVVKIGADGAPAWGRVLGGAQGTQSATAVAIDPSTGEVVVGGAFSGSYPLAAGLVNSMGGTDIFVVAFTASGSVKWQRIFGGTGSDFLSAMVVRPDNRIALAGDFTGMPAFGGGALPMAMGRDMFLATLGPSGTHLNSQSFGGNGTDFVFDVTADTDANVYVAGSFNGTLNAGNYNAISNGQADLVAVVFSPSASPALVTGAGGPGDEEMTALDVGPNGTVAMAVNYRSDFSFLGVDFVNGGNKDMLFAISSFAQMTFEGAGFPAAAEQRVTDIALQPGKVVMVGRLSGAVDVGGLTLPVAGAGSYFIAGFDDQQQPLFGRTFAQPVSSDPLLQMPCLGSDGAGNFYMAGTFDQSFTLDGMSLDNVGDNDIFVIKFK